MRFVLVDLDLPGGTTIREHAGSFGARMSSSGVAGRVVQWLKERLVRLPVTSFGYAAAMLREAGHEVGFSRGPVDKADVVVVASSLQCHRQEAAYCLELKRRMPEARIGLYGIVSSLMPDLFPGADFVIDGELEAAVAGFLEGTHDFRGRVETGVLKDLGPIPCADWRGMDAGRFSYFPLLHKRPVLPVVSSRGCSYACSYCSYMPMQGRAHRRRSPEAVVAEIAEGRRRNGARSYLFRDICFSLNRGHALEIAQRIRRDAPGVEWACETRVDCLDEALIDAMADSGFRGVNLGIESPDPEILKRAGKKPVELERQERIIGYLLSRGVRVNAFYILGLPGETPETMRATIAYARRLNTVGAQFCVLTPFPGTPLYAEYEGKLLTRDFARFTEYEPVVDIGSSTPAEVSEALAQAYGYYLRWGWISRHGGRTALRAVLNVVS